MLYDILVTGLSSVEIQCVQYMLKRHFKLTSLGDLKYFLGLEIAKSAKGIHLCQRKYTLQLLHYIGFAAVKPALIPVDSNVFFFA